MAQFSVGEKVTIPGTIQSIYESEEGIFYDVKMKATNSTKLIKFEEEDIVPKNVEGE